MMSSKSMGFILSVSLCLANICETALSITTLPVLSIFNFRLSCSCKYISYENDYLCSHFANSVFGTWIRVNVNTCFLLFISFRVLLFVASTICVPAKHERTPLLSKSFNAFHLQVCVFLCRSFFAFCLLLIFIFFTFSLCSCAL